MSLCIHQNASMGAGYRKSLEGLSQAGIENVEITDRLLDDFLKTDTLAAANRVVKDPGLFTAAWPRARLVRPPSHRKI